MNDLFVQGEYEKPEFPPSALFLAGCQGGPPDTRAANQLRVSQSALSAQIRQLEGYLGRALFDRTGRSLVLTEFGTTVLDYADGIFGLGQELMARVRGGEGQRIQQLRVGAVATLSRNFLENLIRPILNRPGVRLSLESGSLEELLGRLQVHNLDVVFSNRPVVAEVGKPWRCVRIDRQSVCLVGPRGREGAVSDFPQMPPVRALWSPAPAATFGASSTCGARSINCGLILPLKWTTWRCCDCLRATRVRLRSSLRWSFRTNFGMVDCSAIARCPASSRTSMRSRQSVVASRQLCRA